MTQTLRVHRRSFCCSLCPLRRGWSSGRRATGNRFKKRASASSAQMVEIFTNSRPKASSPDCRSGRSMAPSLFATNSPLADTLRARLLGAQASVESRIVSIDVATGARVEARRVGASGFPRAERMANELRTPDPIDHSVRSVDRI